jgi:hypothetical protein
MHFPSTFTLTIRPNASKTELISFDDSFGKMNVKAAPEKGKANAEIIRFFKKEYGLSIDIISGHTSRKKLIRIVDPNL